jgi:glutaminyl-peptide cyclotransferase
MNHEDRETRRQGDKETGGQEGYEICRRYKEKVKRFLLPSTLTLKLRTPFYILPSNLYSYLLSPISYLLLLFLVSCQQKMTTQIPQILNTYPHDAEAFTQGLVYANNKFYESTGLNGRSSLREVDIKTGEVIRILSIEEKYFAEGLAKVGNKLIQITWENGEAFVYDLETFEKEKMFRYEGEGWGLCYDGNDLYMSDGNSTLFKRNPETFEITGEIQVKLNGQAVEMLNELECVDGFIYANVWQTDRIVKIDKTSGFVVTDIDASTLLSAEERQGADVLNGIAYNPETQAFFLTGKLWPKLFEVKFVEKK